MDAITPRDLEINRESALPMDAVRVARDLLHGTRSAALATLDPGGFPYAITTNLVPSPDGSPVVFMARLSLHARNLAADPRASLTMASDATDVVVAPRLSLSGRMELVPPAEMEGLKSRYLRHFPKAKLYLALPDAQLYRLRIGGVQLSGGPRQNAHEVTPVSILTDLAGAGDLVENEAGLIEALNARPRTAARIAIAAGADGDGPWKITALDPDGVDLARGRNAMRWWFPARAATAAQARAFIEALG